MKDAFQSIKLLLLLSALLGLAYPFAMMAVGHMTFPHKADGGFIQVQGRVVGAELIAQKFVNEKYFWPRPSAIDYNPLPSGGSNLSPASQALKAAVTDREQKLKSANPSPDSIPQELLYASGSGLDPDISPGAAKYQIARVARARGLDPQRVSSLVDSLVEKRQLVLLGEPRINVLKLNLALDDLQRGTP